MQKAIDIARFELHHPPLQKATAVVNKRFLASLSILSLAFPDFIHNIFQQRTDPAH
jgi:hypothetical protein